MSCQLQGVLGVLLSLSTPARGTTVLHGEKCVIHSMELVSCVAVEHAGLSVLGLNIVHMTPHQFSGPDRLLLMPLRSKWHRFLDSNVGVAAHQCSFERVLTSAQVSAASVIKHLHGLFFPVC